ncbi:hypothetical protein GWE18_14625 [Bradyrhizobium sp. CSA112]|uniref:hypothetical protein n=1 Tax=Bradyrhizobium sp. CSA112 TaxID=2699170 RepID=UPI0023B162F8|nr:hypothetical protein [Bradyrhizobium sp. CSA112]MDE5454075.1 hypothetical protein [Bradyrhizobium sp. CSA112]
MKTVDRCANYWSSQSGHRTGEFIGKCCLSSAVNSINSHADRSIWRYFNKALRELGKQVLSLVHSDWIIRYLPGPRGLPLLKPPFGSIVAIDMNSGEHRWRIPVGRSDAMAPIRNLGIRGQLGLPHRSWVLVTKTAMIVVQAGYFSPPRFVPGLNWPIRDLHNFDPHLWVYDKSSGEMLAEIVLPSNATGAPITYMAGGKQYVVFPVGGGPIVEELIAVSL